VRPRAAGPPPTRRLDGRVALVTGAARGQGRTHAVRLAQEGADVIAVDVCGPVAALGYPAANRGDLEETARLVRSTGARLVAAETDVRGLSRAVDEGVAALGRLDVVVANAGISAWGGCGRSTRTTGAPSSTRT